MVQKQRGAGDREIGEIHGLAGAKHGEGTSNSLDSKLSVENDDIKVDDGQSYGEAAPHRSGDPDLMTASMQSEISNKEEEMKIRNTLLVVAALIANATYQAVLKPPSYKIKVDDSYKKGFFGYGDFNRACGYIFFISFNTLGFLLSVQTIVCLTRDLPVRRPLLLSLFAMVTTYTAFMTYAPYASLDIAYNVKNSTLFTMLPMLVSTLLLLTQRWSARYLEHYVTVLSKSKIAGGMYNLREVVSDTRTRRQRI